MVPLSDFVSDQLAALMPRSFGNFYLVYSDEDVSILQKIVAFHGETHPTAIVYPLSQAMKKLMKTCPFLVYQWLI